MTDHELNTIKAIREALPAPEKHLADDIAGIIRGLRTECDRLHGIQDEHRALFARHVDHVNHFADTRRIIAWLDNPKRMPANTAFTSGPERQMAYRFEMLWSARNIEVTADTKAIIVHANTFNGDEGRALMQTLSAAFAAHIRIPVLVLPREFDLTAADDDALDAIGLQRKEPA